MLYEFSSRYDPQTLLDLEGVMSEPSCRVSAICSLYILDGHALALIVPRSAYIYLRRLIASRRSLIPHQTIHSRLSPLSVPVSPFDRRGRKKLQETR